MTERDTNSQDSSEIADALDVTSETVSPDTINRCGVEKIRVLSESKFRDLLASLIERKMRQRLRKRRSEASCADVSIDERYALLRTSCDEFFDEFEGERRARALGIAAALGRFDDELVEVERSIVSVLTTLRAHA